MSTVNLKLEQIKDEDFIENEESIYQNFNDTKTNIAECGRVFLNFQMKTFSFCCFFCEMTFQEVYDLVEHVTDNHMIVPHEDMEDLYEVEYLINGNSIELTACPEEAEGSNDVKESIYEKGLNQSVDMFTNPTANTQSEFDDKTLAEKYKLQDNLDVKKELLPFQCNQCSKAFRTKEFLRYHSSLHSNSERELKCTHCDQIFAKKRYLQMHLNYHLDEKSFPCAECGKQNRTAHQLKIHMLKHSSTKGYVCETCGSSYRLRHHLVTHQRQTHENKREFKCNKCDMAFNTLSFLNNHKISHLKERKHICNICGSSFVWRKNLTEHVKLHSDKAYKCEMCGKSFFQKSGLITHAKSHTTTN